ncbi:hypothetical protein OCH80_09890 [Lactobacillus sp. 23-2]|uniref:hypothetical protein n=1 Tax=Lactobacillus sp. 23-2 TaxID=2981842 RepID=UPI003835164E
MGKKLKAISKVSVALALLGAAVPAVEAAPTAMAAKKSTKKAKKSTKKVAKKSTKKAKKAKKSTKKTTPKKIVKKSMPKKTVKRTTPNTTNYVTFYNSKGKPTDYYVPTTKNKIKAKIKKGSKVSVLGQGPINGQLMYEIDHDPYVYVPAKDVKVDYFTDVHFVDYYLGSGTPAQIKAKYDADLAEREKNEPENGFTMWFNAHPLEDLRMGSRDTIVSKSTYEKHNLTYAQRAAQTGRMSVGYTKESYAAYIKGEKAYRQYEAKWAAKYPNITKYMEELFKNDSDYKKYNLNTFEWHFNDKFYIHFKK